MKNSIKRVFVDVEKMYQNSTFENALLTIKKIFTTFENRRQQLKNELLSETLMKKMRQMKRKSSSIENC